MLRASFCPLLSLVDSLSCPDFSFSSSLHRKFPHSPVHSAGVCWLSCPLVSPSFYTPLLVPLAVPCYFAQLRVSTGLLTGVSQLWYFFNNLSRCYFREVVLDYIAGLSPPMYMITAALYDVYSPRQNVSSGIHSSLVHCAYCSVHVASNIKLVV